MGVKIINRRYREIYTDGETDWLLGNVGEWQKTNINVEVTIDYNASQASPLRIDYLNNALHLSGETWGQLGFDSGMVATLRYKFQRDTNSDGVFNEETIIQQQLTINNVFESVLEVEEDINGQEFETIPNNFGNRRIIEVRLTVDQDPEGCSLKYSHFGSESVDSNTLRSAIDNTETRFIYPNLNDIIVGQWVDMEPNGLQSGMSIRNARVRKTSNNSENVFTSYNIPEAQVKALSITNVGFTTTYDSVRSIIADIQTPQPDHQSSTSDGLLTQNSSGTITSALQSQCIIFNADSSYTQQLYVNINLRVPTVVNLSGTSNEIRLSLVEFTGGSSFNFVSKTTLRSWSDVQSMLNEDLNFNGIVDLSVNATDSYIIIVEFIHSVVTGSSVGLTYKIESGLIQLSPLNGTFAEGATRAYEFEIEYMISSLFDSISNFEDGNPPSYLIGDGSLQDNFDLEFFPEWNNPNVIVRNDVTLTKRLGNTGWYNENFNELENEFKVESISYLDADGNEIDSLDYFKPTKVVAKVSGIPNINSASEFGFGFSWVPLNEADFQNKETPFYQNVFVSSGNTENGFTIDTLFTDVYPGAGIGGAAINVSNVRFTNQSGNIIFEATFTPNAAFSILFESKNEDDRNYILWFSGANSLLTRNFSDRVSLLLDFKSLIKSIPAAGPYDNIDNNFIEHPYGNDYSGVKAYEGFVQDDILCRMPIRIPKDGSIQFNSITYGFEAFNIAENRSYTLEEFQIDLSAFPIDSEGVPQFNFEEIRGFKLNSGNNKNIVELKRAEGLDTATHYGYLGYFATKLRWEDWILRQDAPGDFYNPALLNNGLNNDWISYQSQMGWQLRYFTEIIATEDNELVLYKNRWPLTIADYDQNTQLAVTHQFLRNSDNTVLNIGTDPISSRPLGVILSDENTRLEIQFQILDTGTWTLANSYGVVTIEIDLGAGRFEQRQLSSIWDREGDNPLTPLSGETKLKLEVDNTNKFLKMSCLIDPDLLEVATRYRITGRVGCFDNTTPPFQTGLYEFRYQDKYQ